MNGFSKRFVELMEVSGFFDDKEKPWRGISYTEGSEIFEVTVNSFRNWCVKDIVPRKTEDLLRVVSKTMHNMGISVEFVNHVCAYVVYGVVTEQSERVMKHNDNKAW